MFTDVWIACTYTIFEWFTIVCNILSIAFTYESIVSLVGIIQSRYTKGKYIYGKDIKGKGIKGKDIYVENLTYL